MSETQTYLRFQTAQRIQHVLLIVSFTTLAVTGLPQKYPLAPVSDAIVAFLGGIEIVRIIHRIAATLFLLEAIYHLLEIGYGLFVRRSRATMLPGLQDARDGIQATLYNLGLAKEPPRMGRYNFTEKMEYWALVWGLLIMGLSGFMLWNPIATARILPGVFIPAAKAAHGAEAVLAVLAILLWHFYHVHLRHWNWSMINGHISRQEMEEDHAQELEAIESGRATPAEIPPAVLRRRQTIYYPVAGVLAVVLLYTLFQFVNLENTALTTVPRIRENVPIYSPQTPTPPPNATPAVTGKDDLTWEGGVAALFKEKCAACHGQSGGLALDSYANALKGGGKGAGFVPGRSDESLLVTVQAAGGHPGQFSPEELDKIRAWIQAGAPEK